MDYVCYLLYSLDTHRTYVGITNNLARRLRQHNGELVGGARATRSSHEWRVLAIITGLDKRGALSVEARIKKTKPRPRGVFPRLTRLLYMAQNIGHEVILDKRVLVD